MIDTIDVKANVWIKARERGKIMQRYEGHNIWLGIGRVYLMQLISYNSFDPDTPFRNDRIKYIGLGIGGSKQNAPAVANNAPVVTAYPGTNNYTDHDPSIVQLERPVRISGGTGGPPYISPSDVWVGRVQAPPTFGADPEVTFRRVFTQSELTYNPFQVIPLSEVGLFTSAANPAYSNNVPVAYDTFPTINKTAQLDLEVVWTIRF